MATKSSVEQRGPNHSFAWAADVLTNRFEEIFDVYQRRLEEIESLLVLGGGFVDERLEEQTQALVDHTASVLRGEETPPPGVEAELYADTQEERQEELIVTAHPDESLRAGVALCEAMLTVLIGDTPEWYSPRETVALSLAIQKSIINQIGQVSMAAYANHLLNKVHETQVEERKRFSRELHDRVAHSIAVVSQSLDLYEFFRERDPEEADERLRRARRMVKETIQVARVMAVDLRDVGNSEGLRIALENLLKASVTRGMEYKVSVEGSDEALSPHVRDQFYLILREGIRNVVSHSGSDRIEVKIEILPEEMCASVTDYGKGFDLDQKPPENGIGQVHEGADNAAGRNLGRLIRGGRGYAGRLERSTKEERA
ncbi:MAG: sensor histidine kinase [Rubrobacteraceae bacterium]